MSRIVCGRGSRGAIVERVQHPLSARGVYTGEIDGDFGPATVKALQAFQLDAKVPATGEVDPTCWTTLTNSPPPSLRERCLQLTSSIEGHGFGLAIGNCDGAWLTWGVIGFTLKYGSLQAIVQEVNRRKPQALAAAFGDKAGELLAIISAPGSEQLAWAESISVPPRKYVLQEPWQRGFAAFGQDEVVQQVQILQADQGYFQPALATARRFGLTSELGVALCFDIHVQNGGVKPDAEADVRAALATHPAPDERTLRELIAKAVADRAKPEYRQNVYDRKHAIAVGGGRANGRDYTLDAWGLDESTATA